MEPLHDVIADSKGRISLGTRHAGERYIITQDKEGRFILEKAILIPEREIWLLDILPFLKEEDSWSS